MKVAIGFNLEEQALEDLVSQDKSGRSMLEMKAKNFLGILQLYLFLQQVLIIYWEGLKEKILGFFNLVKNWFFVKTKCLHTETFSLQFIILKRFTFLEAMIEKIKYS